jgi:hypothetical protein
MTTARPLISATVVEFLEHALANGALDVAELEATARKAGLLGTRQQITHAKAFKKAKRSLGIRSIRDGFGNKGKWAWLLPAKPVKPAKKEADCPKDANTREQARSVIVNLNGLPAELLSGRIPPHWIDGIARLESHRVPKEVPAHRWRQFINDCHTFLVAKENWAERAAKHGWNDLELFGCCRRPLERLGNAGLLWAINGGRLVELRRDWAVIERASDRSRHVHQRKRPKAADITLPWILFSHEILAVFPSPRFPCHAFRIGRLDRHSGRSVLPRWCHSDAMDRQTCPFPVPFSLMLLAAGHLRETAGWIASEGARASSTDGQGA